LTIAGSAACCARRAGWKPALPDEDGEMNSPLQKAKTRPQTTRTGHPAGMADLKIGHYIDQDEELGGFFLGVG
jgi:hypothetical protein